MLAQIGGTGACGPATAATIGAVDAAVARKVYTGELTGHEVGEDVARVAGSAELASAVAGGNPAAAIAVVHQIVYTPHWHIVRLRVIRAGKVLADVGGPYIIAPITGTLRQNGVKVGSFVMSVQDDVGYVKLVTRFTGVPIDLYGGAPPRPPGKFLMGTLQPAPRLPSDGATVKAHGSSYLARVAQVNAMPNGKLHVVLLVPAPTKGVSSRSCAARIDTDQFKYLFCLIRIDPCESIAPGGPDKRASSQPAGLQCSSASTTSATSATGTPRSKALSAQAWTAVSS